jgi:hypothetical protein
LTGLPDGAPSWRTGSEAPKGRAARGSVSPRKVACRATLPGRTFRTVQGHRLAHGASPVAALTSERCDIPSGTDMTPHILENFSTWLSVGITGKHCRRETQTTMMMTTRTKKTKRMRTRSRRSSENPTTIPKRSTSPHVSACLTLARRYRRETTGIRSVRVTAVTRSREGPRA